MNDYVTSFIMDNLIDVTASIVPPLMFFAFFFGILFRILLWYTARSELKFCTEFEKRVRKYFIEAGADRIESFFVLTKKILEKTYYEVFELRARYRRRNLDTVATFSDRVFLIQDGAAYLVRDTLRQARYLKREGFPPRMTEVAKGAFELNPVFNKLLGIFPAGLTNEMLNILPGLFIIAGIFGTFLGIAKGLPELGGMDLQNLEETKKVMDVFLLKISQAMVKSILGIALSVTMSLVNTIFAAEGVYFLLINKYSAALEILWNETKNNQLDAAGETSTVAMTAKLAAEPKEKEKDQRVA